MHQTSPLPTKERARRATARGVVVEIRHDLHARHPRPGRRRVERGPWREIRPRDERVSLEMLAKSGSSACRDWSRDRRAPDAGQWGC